MFSSVRRFINAIIARRLLHGFTRPSHKRDGRRHDRSWRRAFRNAYKKEPAYRRVAEAAGVHPPAVRTREDFHRIVPVTDKAMVFGPDGYVGYLAPRRRLAALYTSSGFTGCFSIGAVARRDGRRNAFFIEEILFRVYGIETRDILVVNCLSLGTDVPLRTLPQARTGLRADSVVEILRRAGPAFGAIALIGEPLFLKRVVDLGTVAGLDWGRLTIFVFTGSEYVSESWRDYMRAGLGQDQASPARGAIVSTLGVTELGLALLFETHDLITLRARLAAPGAAHRWLGTEPGAACPQLMHFLPGLYGLETLPAGRPWGELCVTTLDRGRLIPLVRYRTGDEVRLLNPEEVGRLFADAGLPASTYRFRGLPAAAVLGRAPRVDLPGGGTISVNEIKEALFRDRETARDVSGNFRLVPSVPGKKAGLTVQLAEGLPPDGETADRVRRALAEQVPSGLDLGVTAFHDFPYGWGHDYERKNRYV
jgi:phenylacetate-coenzyme A ligase PaaK-like adenylate-forming protein